MQFSSRTTPNLDWERNNLQGQKPISKKKSYKQVKIKKEQQEVAYRPADN